MLKVSSISAQHLRTGLTAVAAALLVTGCGQESEAANTAAPAAVAASGTASGAAATTKGSAWLETVTKTPDGGFLVGNPNAKVKLVEYASFTCSHCADFHKNASTELKSQFVASGKVSFELRNVVLNGPDAAMSLIVRCEGPKRFFPVSDIVFTRQADWIKGFQSISDAQQKQLETTPQNQQLATLARFGGLDTWLKPVGIPKSRIDQCLAKQDDLNTLNEIRRVAFETHKISGTPSFLINGKSFDGQPTWPAVKARLLELTQ